MRNEEAMKIIAARRDRAVVIVTMTSIFTYPDANADPLTLRCAPLMGGASSIGLGLALARPDRSVIVVDGDGSLVMQLGALATIAEAAPANLLHLVCNNRVLYEGGGRVPIANGGGVDFVDMARAAGYREAVGYADPEDFDHALPGLLETPGPTLVNLDIEVPDTPRWSNDNPHAELPDWWFTMLGDDAAALSIALDQPTI